MTDRTIAFLQEEPTQGTDEGEATKAGMSDRRLRKPAILQPFDPAESMSTAKAAREAGISERQMRTWCSAHRLGRKIGGRYHVSRPLFSMYRDGDTGAHDDG